MEWLPEVGGVDVGGRGLNVAKRGNTRESCGDGTVLYLDCGGGYMELHM